MKAIRNTILAATLVLGATAAVPASALDAGQSVATRQAIMWSIAGHLGGIKSGLKAGNGKTVGAAARSIAGLASILPPLFVAGTHQGSKYKSRAKKEIWAQSAKFAAAFKVLQREAMALAKVAKSNDVGAMGKQFGMMAKLGCGGCHRPFRGPKAKK